MQYTMTHQINKVARDCRDIRRKVGNNGDVGTCVIYAHGLAVLLFDTRNNDLTSLLVLTMFVQDLDAQMYIGTICKMFVCMTVWTKIYHSGTHYILRCSHKAVTACFVLFCFFFHYSPLIACFFKKKKNLLWNKFNKVYSIKNIILHFPSAPSNQKWT